MQRKNVIVGITIGLLLIIIIVRELPLDIDTVPVATISIPRISWIDEDHEDREETIGYIQTGEAITDKSNVSIVCKQKKTISPIEDLFCMKPPAFLPNYRNPCWHQDGYKHLSCLPYFLQIGMSKCATTDLFDRLTQHPDVAPIRGANGNNKSISWWNLRHTGSTWQPPYKGGRRESFKQYTGYFDKPAQIIEKSVDSKGFHGKVTGEGSPTYIWMLHLWRAIPQNELLEEPKVLMPHLIKHMLPNMKFIVTLREPVERMFSSYNFFNQGPNFNKVTFHKAMKFGIEKFDECRRKKGERLCIMDPVLRATITQKVRLLNSIYYLFIKEWLDVFPRNQFIFIKMEEYVTNKEEVLNRIFKFLDLPELSSADMEKHGLLYTKIRNKTKGSRQYEPMLNETREMLYNFYDPYTKMLPSLLNDPSFTWPKISYEEYVQKMERKKLASQNITSV